MQPNQGENSPEQTKSWKEILAETGTSISEVVQFMQVHERCCLECRVGQPKAEEACSSYQEWLKFIKEFMFKDIAHFKLKLSLRGESLEVINYLHDKKIEFLEAQGKVITSKVSASLDQQTILEGKVRGAARKINEMETLINNLKGVIKQLIPDTESEDIHVLIALVIKQYRFLQEANRRQTEYMEKLIHFISTINSTVEQSLMLFINFMIQKSIGAENENTPFPATFAEIIATLRNTVRNLKKLEAQQNTEKKLDFGANKLKQTLDTLFPSDSSEQKDKE